MENLALESNKIKIYIEMNFESYMYLPIQQLRGQNFAIFWPLNVFF